MKILRRLNTIFVEEMERAGYGRLVASFIGEFSGQLAFLEQALDVAAKNLGIEPPSLTWTAEDRNVFSSFRLSATDGLENSVQGAGVVARNKVMFAGLGLRFSDLVDALSESFKASIGRATTLADTFMSMFYRIAADRQFQVIEEGLPKNSVRYLYTGPMDKLTRAFCAQRIGKTYTREQIDRMDNGQMPNVMITMGGYNCRHQWVPEIVSAKQQAA